MSAMPTLPGPMSVAPPQLLEVATDTERIRSSHPIEIIDDKVLVRDVELFSTGEDGPLGKVDADRLSGIVSATNRIISRGRSTMIVLRHGDPDGETKQDTIGRISGQLRVSISPFSERPTIFGDMEFGRAEFDAWVRPNGFPRRSAEIVPIEADDGPDDLVGENWIFQVALLGRELPKCDLRDLHVFERSGRVVTPHLGGDRLRPIEVFRIPQPRDGEGEDEYLARTDAISRDDAVEVEAARVVARQVWTAKKGNEMPDTTPFDEIVKRVRDMTGDDRKKLFGMDFDHEDDDDKKKDDDKDNKSDNARDDDDDKDKKDEDRKKDESARSGEVASYARLQETVDHQGAELLKLVAELGKTKAEAAARETTETLRYMRDVEGFVLNLDTEVELIATLPEEQRKLEIARIRDNYKRETTANGIVVGSQAVTGMAVHQRPAGSMPPDIDIDKVTKCAADILREDPTLKADDPDVYARAMTDCGYKDYLGQGVATSG